MKKNKRKCITLEEWINERGTEYVSQLLGVHPSTVRYWRTRHSMPRVDQMRIIKKVTKGACGYDQIIDGGTTV